LKKHQLNEGNKLRNQLNHLNGREYQIMVDKQFSQIQHQPQLMKKITVKLTPEVKVKN
jgi:hypothetical protein